MYQVWGRPRTCPAGSATDPRQADLADELGFPSRLGNRGFRTPPLSVLLRESKRRPFLTPGRDLSPGRARSGPRRPRSQSGTEFFARPTPLVFLGPSGDLSSCAECYSIACGTRQGVRFISSNSALMVSWTVFLTSSLKSSPKAPSPLGGEGARRRCPTFCGSAAVASKLLRS